MVDDTSVNAGEFVCFQKTHEQLNTETRCETASHILQFTINNVKSSTKSICCSCVCTFFCTKKFTLKRNVYTSKSPFMTNGTFEQ